MKAAWFEKFGPAADVLIVGDQPDPIPGSNEVLISVKTSGVNPSDVKKRAGAFPDLLQDGLVIPHSDGAGVIEAVGSEVPRDRVGERVWVYQAQFGRRFGTAAEYVAVDQHRAVPMTDNMSFEVGACLGIPAMTAHRCVFSDGPVEGQTILVTGGVGRVGHYAIQWAAQAGATVIATASTPEDDRACKEAGASAVINHRDANWSAAVLDHNHGEQIDRVIDVEFGANLPEVIQLIRTGGTIATYSSSAVPKPELPFLKMMYLDLTIRMVIVYAMPETAKQMAIADIKTYQQAGRLRHRIARTVPLAEIVDAHELIEHGGFRGCVVVALD